MTGDDLVGAGAIVLGFLSLCFGYVWLKARSLRKDMGDRDGAALLGAIVRIMLACTVAAMLGTARLIMLFFWEPETQVLRTVLAVVAQGLVLGSVIWALMRARAGFA